MLHNITQFVVSKSYGSVIFNLPSPQHVSLCPMELGVYRDRTNNTAEIDTFRLNKFYNKLSSLHTINVNF